MRPDAGVVSKDETAPGVLHLLISVDTDARADCTNCCAAEDTVALLADGVISLLSEAGTGDFAFPGRVVVSKPDLEARGLPDGLAEGLELIDDDALVALIASHRHCLSWI